MNSQPKEVLGYHTPFNVYYGRGFSSADEIRNKASEASDRCFKRSFSRCLKKNPCSIYRKGDKVLLRYPFSKSRLPQKHHVLKGKVLKRAKSYCKYFVIFLNPQKEIVRQWVNVEDITSRTKDEEKLRRAMSAEKFIKIEQRIRHQKSFIFL